MGPASVSCRGLQRKSKPSVQNGEFALDACEEGGLQALALELVEGFVQETKADHLARLLLGYPPGAQVKDLLIGNGPGGGAVGALHLVGVNLQTGHGVGLGLVAAKEISAGLI